MIHPVLKRLLETRGQRLIAWVLIVLFVITSLASLLASASSSLGGAARHYLTFYKGFAQIAIVLAAIAGALRGLYLAYDAIRGSNSGKRNLGDAFFCILGIPIFAFFAGGAAALVMLIPVAVGELIRIVLLNLLLGYDVQPTSLPPLPPWWPRIPFPLLGD